MRTRFNRFATTAALAAGCLIATALPAAAQYSTPTRDVDNGARQPFNVDRTIILNYGTVNDTSNNDTTIIVPAGKRLVIETVSIYVALDPGQLATARIRTTANGVPVYHYFPMTKTYSSFGLDVFTCMQNVRLYSDPGSTLNIITERSTASGPALDAVFRVSITGYYVTLP